MQLSPVPPQRNQAAIVIPQDRPVYRAKSQCYFEDELLQPGTIFAWEDAPNLDMEPMNEKAAKIFKEYIAMLDEKGRAAAEKAGRHYVSLADAHENAIVMAQKESKKFEILNGSREVPLMGGKKKRAVVEKIDAGSAPLETTAKNPKFSLNGDSGKNAVNKSNGGI